MAISQLKSGVILSYFNMFIGILIPFLYTPIMLLLLGQAEYGLYSLANSVISYASILSLGFGTTIVRYIAKFRAEDNRTMLEGTYGFFFEVYSVLACLVLIGGFFLSGNLDTLFNRGLSAAEIDKMHYLVMIMTVNAALSFPHSVFTAIITAHERFVFKRMLDISVTVACPLLNLIALYLGFLSIGLALVSTLIQTVMLPINWLYCSRRLHVSPRFNVISKELIREMLFISVYNFMGAIVDMLFWATGKVMLGMLSSTVAVAIYNIGCTFNSMVINFSTCISSVLVPRITQMVTTKNNINELSELFIKIGRLQFIIISLIISGFAVFGQEFILLWVGPDYLDSYWIALLTLVPLSIPLIQNTGINIIVAQNRQCFRSILYLIIAIINVFVTYFCIPKYGVIGAAWCSAISFTLGQGIIMNIYYCFFIHLNIRRFWLNILTLAWFPLLLCIGSFYIKRLIIFDNYLTLFICCIIYSSLFLFGMAIFGLNSYEKSLFNQFTRFMKII